MMINIKQFQMSNGFPFDCYYLLILWAQLDQMIGTFI